MIVAEIFEKDHASVLRDIRNLHCSEEFRASNFVECLRIIKLEKGQSRQKYYEITQDGFSFLVMGYTGYRAGEFKEKFIKAFNQGQEAIQILENDDIIVLKALDILARKTKALEQNLEEKTKQLETAETTIKENAPRLEYYNEVLISKSGITTTVIAKELGMSATALNNILKERKIIYKVGDTYVLYSKYQNRGYQKSYTVHFTDKEGNPQTKIENNWTERGRRAIHDFIKGLRAKGELLTPLNPPKETF